MWFKRERTPKAVYKSLETDDEFAKRVRAAKCYVPSYVLGADLDDYMWAYYRLQRRIIERES